MRESPIVIRHLALALTIMLSMTWGTHAYEYDPEDDPMGIDHPMFVDPYLDPIEKYRDFPSGYKELWVKALKRPEANYRRRAADAIGKAYEVEMTEMAEAADDLLKLLGDPKEHRLVRMAAARALHRLNAAGAAPILLEDIRGDDFEIMLVADKALAHWKHKPAEEVWTRRVQEMTAPRNNLVSAMNSLATAQFTAAADVLVQIAMDDTIDKALRMGAAKAAATLQSSGLESSASELWRGALHDRLIAATLISTHHTDAAQKMMLTMAMDSEPSVAAIALKRLLEIDPLLITPISPPLITNSDPIVRHVVAQSLVAQASKDAVVLLAPRLDDVNPTLRRFVRDSMIELSRKPGLDKSVRDQAVTMLASDRWRGLEQAAIVLGRLDHESSSGRLLELMRFNRHEVRIASVAALRWMEIPAHLPTIHQRAEEVTNAWGSQRRDLLEKHDQELAQLNQIFGVMNYKPAEKLMARFIPKHSFGHYARAGAVWDLGIFFAEQPDNPYPELLAARLADNNPQNPELPKVRRQSAIAIGRMRASSQLEVLRLFYDWEERSVDVGGACRWAIMHITGEQLPPLEPLRQGLRQFFLEPVRVK